MIFRKLVVTALGYAARNPAIQKQAKKISIEAALKAKPALLKGSRVAGEKYRDIKQEVKRNVEEFKKEK